MGYNTYYDLKIKDCVRINTIIEELSDENDDAAYALDENGNTEMPCKWYDHDEDLKEFSKKYPELLFILNVEGEEPGDIWREYFKNGKMYSDKAEIIFPEFDESKLK